MELKLNRKDLVIYLGKQIDHFFPDNVPYAILPSLIDKALEKVEYCFKHIKLNYFWKKNKIYFNYLNADQYAIFVYYASNLAYEYYQCIELASKLFYLNKILHGFHCMYDTTLPDIFLLIHGTGTVLGKAKYNNYFVVTHNITVGANSKWETPVLEENIIMYPNSSIIGNSHISNNTCMANGSFLMDFNTSENSLIIGRSPELIVKQQKTSKRDIYFHKFNS